MPTLIIKGKITKGYDHWLAAFDGSEDLRNTKYGIQTIYRGQDLNEPNIIHVVMRTPTMEAVQKHMKNDAELISEAVVTQVQKLTQCSWHQIRYIDFSGLKAC